MKALLLLPLFLTATTFAADPEYMAIPWACADTGACAAVVGPFGEGTAFTQGKIYSQKDERKQSTCCQLAAGLKDQVCRDGADPRGVWVTCQ